MNRASTLLTTLCLVILSAASASHVQAAEYIIDTRGAHASIEFKVQHLGYSWVRGRFNTFDGTFSYDPDRPEASRVRVTIDVSSIDSNHAERDKHLRGKDYLNAKKYAKASFISTAFTPDGHGGGTLSGDFTLHGVTRPLEIAVRKVGEGKDPWGGYRAGFSGTAQIKLHDFGIEHKLGAASEVVHLELEVEGVRK